MQNVDRHASVRKVYYRRCAYLTICGLAVTFDLLIIDLKTY